MDDRVVWLHDPSGGRGVLPDVRPSHPGDCRFLGFAGGLRPENAREVLESLRCVEAFDNSWEQEEIAPFWIDGETGFRDSDDWFSLDKVEATCRAIWPKR